MTGRIKDMSGERFGRLTVVRIHPLRSESGGVYWLCKCECGTEKAVLANSLRTGDSKSCGCLNSELTASRNRKHGCSKTSDYYAWKAMVQRCTNPSNKSFYCYGGRGIRVCERWMEFTNFVEDMGSPPSGMCLERKDNNGDYCPENCKWATMAEQNSNKSNNINISAMGKTMNLTHWAKQLGVYPNKIKSRMLRGESGESVIKAIYGDMTRNPSLPVQVDTAPGGPSGSMKPVEQTHPGQPCKTD